jgi:hypothetical protein
VGTWLDIATFPVCLAVSVVGIALSVMRWRKKGARSGLRGIAWSLLPIAAWLTHSIRLIGRIGSAVVQFGSSFVFSPETWLGVILVGLAVVLFLVSGGIPLVGSHRRKVKARAGAGDKAQLQASVPAKRDQPAVPAADDDDLGDVHEILRRHGIH